MTTDTKTLSLIQKLLAKADSAASIGSTEEAAAFAAKASELLLRHKLSLSDLEVLAEQESDPMFDGYYDVTADPAAKLPRTKNRTQWLTMLANVLCRAHFCRMLVITGEKTIRIIGRESDVMIVRYLYATLAREGYRLGISYEKQIRYKANKEGTSVPPRLAASFRLGFIAAIQERLTKMRREVEQQAGQHAIVRFHQADRDVQDYLDNLKRRGQVGKVKALTISGTNQQATQAGYAAGQRAALHQGLNQGGTTKAGRNLLGGGK
jgi:hypothetical protein